MELLDRYLEAVRKNMPWKRQNDLLTELRANLEAQLEDKESVLGRPLTKEEAEAWVKQLGSPMQMAARYQPQQYLIGPVLFPIYWLVMRKAFLWFIVIYVVASVIQAAGSEHPGSSLLGAAGRLPWQLLGVAAWITLSFAVTEFVAVRIPSKLPPWPPEWSPSSLPPLDGRPSGPKPRTRTQAVAGLAFNIVGLAFWLLAPIHPYLLLGPGAAYLKQIPFEFAPVCWTFYWCMAAIYALQIVWRAVELVLGQWPHTASINRVAFAALALIPQSIMLFAPGHAYFTLRSTANSVQYAGALDSLNHGVYVTFCVFVAITLVQLLCFGGQLATNARKRSMARA
jgi:hypothetical protein